MSKVTLGLILVKEVSACVNAETKTDLTKLRVLLCVPFKTFEDFKIGDSFTV